MRRRKEHRYLFSYFWSANESNVGKASDVYFSAKPFLTEPSIDKFISEVQETYGYENVVIISWKRMG